MELLEIRGNLILVKNVDIIDKTPVIDIKPYLSQFDSIQTTKIGWLYGQIKKKRS